MGLPPVRKSVAPHLLYVDGLNYMKYFLGLESNHEAVDVQPLDVLSCMESLEEKVGLFMKEARQAGWKVSVFLDNCKIDPEEIDKWWARGRGSMEEGGSRGIPPTTTLLLGSAFKHSGASVHYSWGQDNDPTLAAHAHLDDAAILSRDGDFLRYFGRKATGEKYFLQKLFSNFSVADARNNGNLALWRKRVPTERYGKDWVLETGVGEVKGGIVPFPSHRPQVSSDFLVLVERANGVPTKRVARLSMFPLGFPCPPHFDAMLHMRSLRLAVYQTLGEEQVLEEMWRWVDDRDGKVTARHRLLWTHTATGWESKQLGSAEQEEEQEKEVAESWEDLDDADDSSNGIGNGDAISAAEAGKIRQLHALLSQPEPPSLAALSLALHQIYAILFGDGDSAIAPAVTNPATAETVAVTDLHRKNEHSARFLSVASYVGGCWPHVHGGMFELTRRFHAARGTEAECGRERRAGRGGAG